MMVISSSTYFILKTRKKKIVVAVSFRKDLAFDACDRLALDCFQVKRWNARAHTHRRRVMKKKIAKERSTITTCNRHKQKTTTMKKTKNDREERQQTGRKRSKYDSFVLSSSHSLVLTISNQLQGLTLATVELCPYDINALVSTDWRIKATTNNGVWRPYGNAATTSRFNHGSDLNSAAE